MSDSSICSLPITACAHILATDINPSLMCNLRPWSSTLMMDNLEHKELRTWQYCAKTKPPTCPPTKFRKTQRSLKSIHRSQRSVCKGSLNINHFLQDLHLQTHSHANVSWGGRCQRKCCTSLCFYCKPGDLGNGHFIMRQRNPVQRTQLNAKKMRIQMHRNRTFLNRNQT